MWNKNKLRQQTKMLRHPCRLRLEALEDRVVPTQVKWNIPASGSWMTGGNWSTGAVPQPGDDVVIDQPGNIQVTLSAGTSVNSIAITGDTLSIAGGTLTVAGAVTSTGGAITVATGAQLAVGGTYTQDAAATLTLPTGTLGTGVGTNLLSNPDLESPTATNSTTAPGSWSTWGTTYLSTQFAQAGKQSLQEFGPNSGALESFSVTPGVSYTGSVYAMTPSTNPLTGPEGGFLQMLFYDSTGTQISAYSAPNSVTVLTSSSSPGGPTGGSVGNQGWNFFTTTAVAPSNAVKVNFQLETGAYTGASGTAGGSTYWDNVQFGPTAVNTAKVTAAAVSNSGTIKVGGGDTVASSGNFTQTSTGTLDVQLGGPPSSGIFGSVAVAGVANLGGKLQADLVNSYAPAVNDGFSFLSYSSAVGTFASYQLPSGSAYAFQPAINPTYAGLAAVPPSLSTTINAAAAVQPISTNMLGVNLAWWDDKLTTSQTQQMVQAAGLNAFRFPGGSSSDQYHFNIKANFGDSVAVTIPQFANFIAGAGGVGLITLDYGSGSPQEAAAELAYLEGSPTSTTTIGTGIEWNDGASVWQNVNWQTVGYWASLRAATPLATDDGLNFLRIGHAAPFSNIQFWEVGNEEYGSWEADHHGTAGPGGVSTGAQHDPATYATFANAFAGFAAQIDPSIVIGIDSADPTGASDNNWTKNVLTNGLSLGFVPGFISDHSYMQGPGGESDSFLLFNTVSNPTSLLDWSTRYVDYQSLLQATLGTRGSNLHVMATEFNSVYASPGKQSTSLTNGLFIADSIGSLLESGYTGGFVWDLRNGWDTSQNDSPSLYGWRQGGDYGLLGAPDTSLPPGTGPYVPYPNYFAEQLASKIVQGGGQVVSSSSNYDGLTVYAVKEANGHLEILAVNKNQDAALPEQINLQGFQANGAASVWQYGEVQDNAQRLSTDGSASLANSSVTLPVIGNAISFTFPAYSMTVLDLTPATVTSLNDNGISATTAGGSVEAGYPISFTVTVAGPTTPTGTIQMEDAANGNALVGSAQTLVNGTVTFTVAATAANNLGAGTHQLFAVYLPGGVLGASQSATVAQVVDSTFKVQTIGATATSNFSQAATGFVVVFNAAVNTGALNLYGAGAASLSFVTGTTSVPGSLVFDSTGTTATFVATGTFPASGIPLAGILAAGASYSVDLSGTNASAFQDSNGHVLGSSSGTGGVDFASTFTSTNSATAVTVSVPYFARGYSQTVNVPANTTSGLPISINVPTGASTVTSASFDLFYDPTLLTVTGGTIAGGFAGTIDTGTPGRVHVTLTTVSLAAGSLTNVVSLTASVPSTAPYRDKEVLQIRNVSINGGTNNGQAGSAVHAATFLDATQGPSIPSTYSAQDAFNILKAAAGLPGAIYNKLLDPAIVADDAGLGRSSAQDAFDVSKKAVGLSVPLIPDLPSGGTPPPVGGPDPYLYLDPVTSAAVGSTVTVHVNLKSLQAGGFTFDSGDMAISFDPTKLQISNVRAGSYSALAGFGSSLFVVTKVDNQAGTLFISEFTTNANGVVIPDGTAGDVVQFDVKILSGFTAGSTVIKLNANIGRHFTDVNGGQATLNPAPNNKRYDPATDDMFNIARKPNQSQPPPPRAAQTPQLPLTRPSVSDREQLSPPTGVSNLITRLLGSSVFTSNTGTSARWTQLDTNIGRLPISNAIAGEMNQLLAALFKTGTSRAENRLRIESELSPWAVFAQLQSLDSLS
jgi:hypothetical protein